MNVNEWNICPSLQITFKVFKRNLTAGCSIECPNQASTFFPRQGVLQRALQTASQARANPNTWWRTQGRFNFLSDQGVFYALFGFRIALPFHQWLLGTLKLLSKDLSNSLNFANHMHLVTTWCTNRWWRPNVVLLFLPFCVHWHCYDILFTIRFLRFVLMTHNCWLVWHLASIF